MNNISQPVTLITGTSRGIGKSLAEYYLKNGHIVIGCSRSNSDIQGDNYTHFNADISVEKDVLPIFTYIKKTYGRLDNLINNAGIASSSLGVLTSTSLFENIMKVNAVGTFVFIREAAKIMIKNNYGRIVNFTATGVPISLTGVIPYLSSKAAIEMMTKLFADELAPYKITVNAVGPAATSTDMLHTFTSDEKYNSMIANDFMIKENSTIDDITNVVDFFLSKNSNHITAQVIYLCGPK